MCPVKELQTSEIYVVACTNLPKCYSYIANYSMEKASRLKLNTRRYFYGAYVRCQYLLRTNPPNEWFCRKKLFCSVVIFFIFWFYAFVLFNHFNSDENGCVLTPRGTLFDHKSFHALSFLCLCLIWNECCTKIIRTFALTKSRPLAVRRYILLILFDFSFLFLRNILCFLSRLYWLLMA